MVSFVINGMYDFLLMDHLLYFLLLYLYSHIIVQIVSSNNYFLLCFRYLILSLSIIQVFIALYTMSSRGGTEAFVSLWSAIFLLLLCAGGTVIMRKFQSSLAVGFFIGSVVAASQMFMLIFLM